MVCRSRQRVSSWLRFLSPPTATWVVPAPLRGEDAPEGFSRRPAQSQRLHAPPGTRPLRCRLVGLWRERGAAIVEVLAADDEWHPAISGLAAEHRESPVEAAVQAGLTGPPKSSESQMKDPQDSQSEGTDKAGNLTLKAPSAESSCNSSPSYGYALPYQLAERAIRQDQQNDKDRLRQEELLVQQEALIHKVFPHERDSQLRALQRLCQQHPQLHAYHQQFYSYPETPQEDAVGALALLPLQELAAFIRTRNGAPFPC